MIDPALVEAFPPLLIVIPILASVVPLVLALRWGRVGWSIAAVVAAVELAMAISLAAYVGGRPSSFGDPSLVHELGGFPRPIGIELVVDELSALLVVTIALVAAGVLGYTRRGGPRGSTFYTAFLLLMGGLNGMALTGDVFNLFVFLEITGLATYALIAAGRSGEAAVASLKYLVVGTVGASLYLVGVGLLFLATGSLNMIDLATAIPATAGYDHPLVRASFAFVFTGFAIKVAQWPMHTWQPDAYQRAPDGITPMIAALVSTLSAYALLRVTYGVYTIEFMRAAPYASRAVVTVGAVSVLAGATLAVIQRDVKRMFAYSSVSQFGLIVLAIGLLNRTALLGAIIHLVGHAIIKGGLFAGAGAIAAGTGARTVDAYAGLAGRRPVAAAAVAALGIVLVGIPPGIGFLGKWLIGLGSIRAGIWPVAVVVFLSTLLTLAYMARLLEKMYFTPPLPGRARAPSADAGSGAGAIATDGGSSGSSTVSDGTLEGDEPEVPAGGRISPGMLLAVVLAAAVAVGLGFAGAELSTFLDPYLTGVIGR